MRPPSSTLQSLRIAAIYVIFAATWILFSDQAVGWYFTDPHMLTKAAMIKGWFFVAVTGALLFALVRRQLALVQEKSLAQHRAEVAGRKGEERFRALANLSPDIISIFDHTGTLVFNSSAAERIHGYTAQDLVGKSTFDFIHPDDRAAVQAAFSDILQNPGKTIVIRYRYLNKNGTYATMEASARNELHNPDLQGVISISRDISERVAAEEEKRSMKEQLVQSQKMEAIGQLAGGVAHDFNNILTVLAMNLEALGEEDLPAHVREMHAELQEATNHASSLTRQLLMFARRRVVQKKHLEVNALIERLLGMLRRLIGENITIDFRKSPDPAWVHADEGMLEQVVFNLAVNARDAMSKGGGQLTISVDPARADAPADTVCISVSDTGCGMDETTRAHLFEPFFTTKEAGRGTGLGLATVFGIVQQHEGVIEVASAPAQGSTFTLRLPRVPPDASSPAPSLGKPAKGRGNERILITEDDPHIRELCLSTLSRAGYQVCEAAHGREALDHWAAASGAFDLLLSDMIMPGSLNALDLARILRREKPSLPVLVMSGYSLELSQHADLIGDRVGYIAKPFTAEQLTAAVRHALDK